MTARTYVLNEVTDALGKALANVSPHDRLTFERPLHLFLDDVVRILKEPARPPEELTDFASPND